MQTVTAISANDMAPEELGEILAGYVALDRVRTFRRVLVPRLLALAVGAGVVGTMVHSFSLAARIVSVLMLLAPAVWVWIVELRMESRLGRRVEARTPTAGRSSDRRGSVEGICG